MQIISGFKKVKNEVNGNRKKWRLGDGNGNQITWQKESKNGKGKTVLSIISIAGWLMKWVRPEYLLPIIYSFINLEMSK